MYQERDQRPEKGDAESDEEPLFKVYQRHALQRSAI